MPAIQAKNRAEIRQSIGYQLGACTVGAATTNGSTTTLVDTINLFGGDDEYNGSWIVITDATDNTVGIRRITDYTASSNTITFAPHYLFLVQQMMLMKYMLMMFLQHEYTILLIGLYQGLHEKVLHKLLTLHYIHHLKYILIHCRQI